MRQFVRLIRAITAVATVLSLAVVLGACGDNGNGDNGNQDAGTDMGQDMGPAGPATVQVIHNAPDPNAATVDVFADGELLIDDFEFRTATPFQELEAGDYTIAIGGSGAGDDDTLEEGETLGSWDVTLEGDTSYTIVASGVANPDDFADPQNSSTDISLNLNVAEGARQQAEAEEGYELRLHHGVTDGGSVDISFGQDGPSASLDYGGFSNYINIEDPNLAMTADVNFSGPIATETIQTATMSSRIAEGGEAATVIASGFGDPAANQQGPELDYLVCPTEPTSGTDRIVCSSVPRAARAQLIHAAPSPEASEAKVCFNGTLLTSDAIPYLRSTGYFTIPSTFEFDVAIVGADASDCSSPLASSTIGPFDGGNRKAFIASGTVGDNLGVRVADTIDFTGNTDTLGITIFHGSPDAPSVDVVATNPEDSSDLPLAENLAFGESALAGQNGIVDVADYSPLRIWQADNDMELFSYDAGPLTNKQSKGVVIVARGFVDPPSGVEDRGFGLTVFDPVQGEAALSLSETSQ
mgnify:CR=1 FL=1